MCCFSVKHAVLRKKCS